MIFVPYPFAICHGFKMFPMIESKGIKLEDPGGAQLDHTYLSRYLEISDPTIAALKLHTEVEIHDAK